MNGAPYSRYRSIGVILRSCFALIPSKRSSSRTFAVTPKQSLCFFLLFSFLINILGPIPDAQAQVFHLPAPGVMVPLSPPFDPAILKGIKVDPKNPFRFDFILDKGDISPSLIQRGGEGELKQQATKLIKYFLAGLTIPEKDLWVNLSPYEKNRIIPSSFGLTEMGRDLLAEDYMLKQITASLIYPEDETGKKFWKRIYEEASKKYGTTNIPINTFNKVWIVPDKAVIYENAEAGTAYVVEAKLKVMLEQDYLSLKKHTNNNSLPLVGRVRERGDINALGSQITREIVIPELTKEVNTGKNFAQLRQIYNSLILAAWYKDKIKDSILEQVYADKNKVAGVGYEKSILSIYPLRSRKNLTGEGQRVLAGDVAISTQRSEPNDVELIYHRYLQAFKKGVFNYIKDDSSLFPTPGGEGQGGGQIPRKYFSGGATFLAIPLTRLPKDYDMESQVPDQSALSDVKIDLSPATQIVRSLLTQPRKAKNVKIVLDKASFSNIYVDRVHGNFYTVLAKDRKFHFYLDDNIPALSNLEGEPQLDRKGFMLYLENNDRRGIFDALVYGLGSPLALRDVFLNKIDILRGQGLTKFLLGVYFRKFPESKSLYPSNVNIFLRWYLMKNFGFGAADQGQRPLVFFHPISNPAFQAPKYQIYYEPKPSSEENRIIEEFQKNFLLFNDRLSYEVVPEQPGFDPVYLQGMKVVDNFQFQKGVASVKFVRDEDMESKVPKSIVKLDQRMDVRVKVVTTGNHYSVITSKMSKPIELDEDFSETNGIRLFVSPSYPSSRGRPDLYINGVFEKGTIDLVLRGIDIKGSLLKGQGLMRFLLALYFKSFPRSNTLSRNDANLFLRLFLVNVFGFKPADQNVRPLVFFRVKPDHLKQKRFFEKDYQYYFETPKNPQEKYAIKKFKVNFAQLNDSVRYEEIDPLKALERVKYPFQSIYLGRLVVRRSENRKFKKAMDSVVFKDEAMKSRVSFRGEKSPRESQTDNEMPSTVTPSLRFKQVKVGVKGLPLDFSNDRTIYRFQKDLGGHEDEYFSISVEGPDSGRFLINLPVIGPRLLPENKRGFFLKGWGLRVVLNAKGKVSLVKTGKKAIALQEAIILRKNILTASQLVERYRRKGAVHEKHAMNLTNILDMDDLIESGHARSKFLNQQLLFTLRRAVVGKGECLIIDVYNLSDRFKDKVGYVVFSYSHESGEAYLREASVPADFKEAFDLQAEQLVHQFYLESRIVSKFDSPNQGLFINNDYHHIPTEGESIDLQKVLMSVVLELIHRTDTKLKKLLIASQPQDEDFYRSFGASPNAYSGPYNFLIDLAQVSDNANISYVNPNGGIDLTRANMNSQTRNAGVSIKFHMDAAMFQRLKNAPGFVPVIIDIQPIKDIDDFLGIKPALKNSPIF